MKNTPVVRCNNPPGKSHNRWFGLDRIAVSLFGNVIGIDEKYKWSRDGKIQITTLMNELLLFAATQHLENLATEDSDHVNESEVTRSDKMFPAKF